MVDNPRNILVIAVSVCASLIETIVVDLYLLARWRGNLVNAVDKYWWLASLVTSYPTMDVDGISGQILRSSCHG